MSQTAIAILCAIISGILATILTFFWQNRAKKIDARREIFNTLMAYRFMVGYKESVIALNCVQATFYDCPKVQEAWKNFLDAADRKPYVEQELIDAQIQLLEEIAKTLGYKSIRWKDIKRNYFPEYLMSELTEERNLRKAQLEVALRNVKEAEMQAHSVDIYNSNLSITE